MYRVYKILRYIIPLFTQTKYYFYDINDFAKDIKCTQPC